MDPFIDDKSNKSGVVGHFETFLRKIRTLAFALCFALISVVGVLCIGLSLGFSVTVYNYLLPTMNNLPAVIHPFGLGILLALSFVTYGIAVIFVAPFLNLILGLRYLVKPFRGNAYSLESIPWYFHNALIYIVRYSFLEYLTPSPLNVLFFKMMGMKVGKGVIINSSNISDACLIELGDYVTIGGSAHLVAHYSQSGYLIVSNIKIGRKTTIGLKATILGDVVIGERCLIKPHALVLPKSRLEDKTTV